MYFTLNTCFYLTRIFVRLDYLRFVVGLMRFFPFRAKNSVIYGKKSSSEVIMKIFLKRERLLNGTIFQTSNQGWDTYIKITIPTDVIDFWLSCSIKYISCIHKSISHFKENKMWNVAIVTMHIFCGCYWIFTPGY